jgi:integration host factor subunit alpha
MTGKSVTRANLTEAVYQQGIVTKEYAANLVDQFVATISTALVEGENVKLSSFGAFTIRTRAKRTGRNPKTGVEVPIEPRWVILFSASPVLKGRINRATSQSSGLEVQDVKVAQGAQYETAS